jgi:hypothetical protein
MLLWLLLLLLRLVMAWMLSKSPAARVEADGGNPRGLTQTIMTEAPRC